MYTTHTVKNPSPPLDVLANARLESVNHLLGQLPYMGIPDDLFHILLRLPALVLQYGKPFLRIRFCYR